jgi:hypothetical protein
LVASSSTIRARLQEVLEVGRRPGEVLAGTVHPQHGITGTGLGHRDPALVVGEFRACLLGKEVVGNAQGQFAVGVEFLDDLVVVGKVLAAATRIDHAGNAQAIQLAHEVARRVRLVLDR